MSETSAVVDECLVGGLRAHVSAVLSGRASRSDRARASTYAVGLVGPTERKSVEPMLRAQLGGARPAQERRMTGSLTDADWKHRSAMYDGAERMVRLAGQGHGMQAYVLDDTALLKQGEHSVGVANQYAGCIGGLANCQSIVTLAMTGDAVHTFVAMELFMPAKWFDDAHAKLRAECRVPARLVHRTKQAIGAELLFGALDSDLPKLPALMDSAYGDDASLRAELEARGVEYVAMISSTKFFPLHVRFEEALKKAPGESGRPSTRLLATVNGAPAKAITYQELGASLPKESWKTLTWRVGSKGPQSGRFAAVRARPSRGLRGGAIRPADLQSECWVLLHWEHDKPAPTRAWVSNFPAESSLEDLVRYARMRWGIERTHQEGKGDIGFDHYEGRTYPGLHHHLALVTLTHQYLALRQLQTPAETASKERSFSPGAHAGPHAAA